MRRSMAPGLWAVLLLLLALPSLGAQELPLKRDLPPGPCESRAPARVTAEPPSEAEQRQAEQLSSEANQAAILGDQDRAIVLLREAAELDPLSSTVAYRLARILEDAGEAEAAVSEFCRYLALEPDAPDAADTRLRAERLADPDGTPLPPAARSAFEEGVRAFDRGAYDEAAQHFSRAVVEAPDLSDAYYNRGVAYLRAGRASAAAADLEWYLETNPGADDQIVVQTQLRQISEALAPSYSPGIALTTGLLVPGMGQFYSGRPGLGFLILSTAGTAATVGIVHKRVEVDCLQVPQNGVCPPEQIVDEREKRPWLVPGLVTAGAITVVGAIIAYRGARRSDAPLTSREGGLQLALHDPGSGTLTPSLRLEPVSWRDGGGARLLLEVRF
ncbi:MAG: tetratricopeptide repeat protein [Longimicrobiales bacterium]|nr:tetratricopeptide repeat protein [Longimicrobiales bacterium]